MKILVIRYRFLGDTILTVPFLQSLKELYPDSEVSVLIGPQSGQLLHNCPYVDNLLDFDTSRFHKYDLTNTKPKSFWNYIGELRKYRFDRAYVLKRSFSSAMLAFLAGIPERIGFDTEGRGFLLTQKVSFNPNQSEVLNFLAHLPAPYNQAPAKNQLLFWPTIDEQNKAQSLLNNLPAGKKVVFHAPAAHPLKMWPLKNWAELLKMLKAKSYQVIFSGSPQDLSIYQQIEELAGLQSDVNLCMTKTSLRENVAVYGLCDLAICVDSGPMHLAAAVNLPVIGLFGPTNSIRWRPWSDHHQVLTSSKELACRPCNLKPICQNYECLTELTATEVFNTALRFAES